MNASGHVSAFDPLRFCPADKRARHSTRAAAAATQRCTIAGCPLFALSARYFGRDDASSPEAAADAGDEQLEAANA